MTGNDTSHADQLNPVGGEMTEMARTARWEVEWALGYLEHRRSYKGKKHRRRMDEEAAKALRTALESMPEQKS